MHVPQPAFGTHCLQPSPSDLRSPSSWQNLDKDQFEPSSHVCPWSAASPGHQHLSPTPPPARNRSPCCCSSPTGHLAVAGSFLKCQSDHTSPLLKPLQRLPIKADKIPNSHQNFQSPHILSLTNLQRSPPPTIPLSTP